MNPFKNLKLDQEEKEIEEAFEKGSLSRLKTLMPKLKDYERSQSIHWKKLTILI